MTKDIAELDVKFGDTINQTVIRDRVEEIAQEDLEYRNAFRPLDLTGINSNTYDIPVPDDTIGQPMDVDELGEYPREQEHYSQKTVNFTKFGFEVAISMEAREDSLLNIVNDQVDRQARQMDEELNNRAHTELDANLNADSPGGDQDGIFTYDDVVDGRKLLKEDHYDPDLLLVDLDASADLLTDSNFVQATDAGDNVRRSGQIGRIAGVDVVEVDDANTISATYPGAYLVDTNYYGYEATRLPVTTEEYTEDRTEAEVYRIKTRMGWKAIQSDAAVKIEG